MNKNLKILITILVIIILGLLSRFVFFKDAVDELNAELNRIGQWEEDYKKEHPNATKSEIDAAFKEGIKGLEEWKESYRQKHPGATDGEIERTFNDAWKK